MPRGADGDEEDPACVDQNRRRCENRGENCRSGRKSITVSVEWWVYLVVDTRERELPVSGHTEGQADGRGLDGEAADIDGREHDEEVEVRRPLGKVAA